MIEALAEYVFRRFLPEKTASSNPAADIVICPKRFYPAAMRLRPERCYLLEAPFRVKEPIQSHKPVKKVCLIVPDTFQKREDLLRTHFCSLIRSFLFEHEIILLHGAVTAKKGLGIAFLGHTGSGKTTTLLSLLENNFSFINDDHVALISHRDKPVACTSSDEMHLLEENVDAFKIVRFAKERSPVMRGGKLKRAVFAHEFLPPSKILKKHPIHTIAFLEHGASKTGCSSVPHGEGWRRLLDFCQIFILPNQRAIRRGFCRLVDCLRSVKFFNLNTGRDARQIPRLVQTMIREAGFKNLSFFPSKKIGKLSGKNFCGVLRNSFSHKISRRFSHFSPG